MSLRRQPFRRWDRGTGSGASPRRRSRCHVERLSPVSRSTSAHGMRSSGLMAAAILSPPMKLAVWS